MPIDLYDHVRIKDKGVTGEVIDIYEGQDRKTYYIVESDKRGPDSDPDAFDEVWPQYDCLAEQLERI